jgi:hypothetical protein
LTDNGIELDGMRALAGRCFRHWHQWQHLNLSGNHVRSDGALALFQAAMLVPHVQFLSLSDCKLEHVAMCICLWLLGTGNTCSTWICVGTMLALLVQRLQLVLLVLGRGCSCWRSKALSLVIMVLLP